MKKLKEKWDGLVFKVKRKILTVVMEIEVKSLFYDCHVSTKAVWFGNKVVEVDYFTAPLTKDYKVDLDSILDKAPHNPNVVRIITPKDFVDRVREARKEDERRV